MGFRSRRRKPPRTERHYKRLEAANETLIRRCCPTSVDEPHLAECVRSSKCRDKKAYATRDDARNAAGHWTAVDDSLETAYRCPSCDRFHIGHPSPEDA
jgi:hypothetical protein